MTFYATISLENLPRFEPSDRVERGLERWSASAGQAGDAALAAFAAVLSNDAAGGSLLRAIFAHSPFLTAAVTADLGFARQLFIDGPQACYERIVAAIEEKFGKPVPRDELARALRRAKRQVALTVAVADLAGVWTLPQLTRRLSRFADACLRAAVDACLIEAASRGAITLHDELAPARDCGFVVLAMGKLGAYELNYSSDIDLVLLYDPDKAVGGRSEEIQQTFTRVARSLVRLLEERTADGYVFRTDLRLRPDPGSTPLAVSILAAETYYESVGQNWERAAMIKARPAAGDLAVGAEFLDRLRPFVWRKHLDFAAIEDIQSIKRQIDAQRGFGEIKIEGHNVKLGRGGIREIEFFVQTQQLIWGGREPTLRCAGTLDGLQMLVALGRLDAQTAADLESAYGFLRQVEHRLQMIDDQQTQTLPETANGIADLAAFMALSEDDFRSRLQDHLRRVAEHYGDLFEQSAPLGAQGPLVFTGEEHHPDTLVSLTELGFAAPEQASTIVRNWHRGRYRAMRSTRARELLTELTPALLAAIGETADPDHALRHFDAFLSGLPSGVQLFSMLHANPALLSLLTEILGHAPRLANTLASNPLILDGVLTEEFFDPLPGAEDLQADLRERLIQARDIEDVLIVTRRWSNDAKFQVGVQLLRNVIDVMRTGNALSDIADAAITVLIEHVERSFADRHGRFSNGAFAVMALGKLGARELTEGSDLDLVFVYDVGDDRDQLSDGARPISPTVYYQRFAQRLITAITAPTGEGKLYEIDLRLRPSGNAGPVSTSIEAFRSYHQRDAWMWERMALTRARVVAAPPDFKRHLESLLRQLLTRPPPADLAASVRDMRARIDREHGSSDAWQIKHVPGGLVDCEFLAQYLQLAHAHRHPEILSPSTHLVFAAAADAGLIDQDAARDLAAATLLWRRIQALLRLCLDANRNRSEGLPPALQERLAAAERVDDLAALEARMHDARQRVRALFVSIIGPPSPAGAARDG